MNASPFAALPLLSGAFHLPAFPLHIVSFLFFSSPLLCESTLILAHPWLFQTLHCLCISRLRFSITDLCGSGHCQSFAFPDSSLPTPCCSLLFSAVPWLLCSPPCETSPEHIDPCLRYTTAILGLSKPLRNMACLLYSFACLN